MNNLGKIKEFKVVKETKLGYMLVEGKNEYFLHHNESNYQILQPGDSVKAFIYADKKGRLAATLYLPTMTVDKIGFGTVVAVTEVTVRLLTSVFLRMFYYRLTICRKHSMSGHMYPIKLHVNSESGVKDFLQSRQQKTILKT